MGVSNSIIVPFVGVEFDPTRAQQGPRALPFKALIMGHGLAASTLTDNVPTLVTSADDVGDKAGFGSQLHMLSLKWFSRNKFTAVYVIQIPEAGAAAASTYDYAITGTATEAGTIKMYMDSLAVSVSVAVGDTAATVAAALKVQVDLLDKKIPFTTSVLSGTLTLTTKSKGASTAGHDVREVYYDTDAVPAGLSVVITETPGTGAADVTNGIVGMGEEWYNIILNPYADTTNLDLIETEMADRFGPVRQIDGLVFFGYDDTSANSITFSTGAARNSPHLVMVDAYKYPQKASYVAALVAAECAKSIENDPGEPLHRITIDTLLPPIATERHSLATLNTMTKSGIFTLDPYAFGGPQTFGTVTMYLKNTSGVDDTSYQYVTTLAILMFIRYDFTARIKTRYPRARLADSAIRIKSGLQVITPDVGKAEAISIAREWEAAGLVENIDQFKKDIICQRSDANPNRLEWILPPDLVNQFIVGSGDMSFILQSA